MNLFTITSELRAIADQWADADTIPDEVLQAVTALEIPAEAKMRSIIGIIKEEEAEADAVEIQEKRLADIKRIKRNRAARLREYLHLNMDMLGVKRYSCDIGEASVAKSPASIEAMDPVNFEGIAREYLRVKIEPNKIMAKDDWKKTGTVPEGFRVIEDRFSLRVK